MIKKYRIEEIGLVESDLKQVYYLACLMNEEILDTAPLKRMKNEDKGIRELLWIERAEYIAAYSYSMVGLLRDLCDILQQIEEDVDKRVFS